MFFRSEAMADLLFSRPVIVLRPDIFVALCALDEGASSLASLTTGSIKKCESAAVPERGGQDDPHKTMDGPATRTEKKGRDKAKSHGTPYSAKHARLAAAAAEKTATATAAAEKEKGKEKK